MVNLMGLSSATHLSGISKDSMLLLTLRTAIAATNQGFAITTSGGTSWSGCCPRYTHTRRSNRVIGGQRVQEGDVDIDVDIDLAIDMLMWLEAFRPITNAET